jgi:hypothetical protein
MTVRRAAPEPRLPFMQQPWSTLEICFRWIYSLSLRPRVRERLWRARAEPGSTSRGIFEPSSERISPLRPLYLRLQRADPYGVSAACLVSDARDRPLRRLQGHICRSPGDVEAAYMCWQGIACGTRTSMPSTPRQRSRFEIRPESRELDGPLRGQSRIPPGYGRRATRPRPSAASFPGQR